MRKILLVSISLLAFSFIYADDVREVSNIPSVDRNYLQEFVKPDAKGRFFLSPERISGLQAVKERMAASAAPARPTAGEIEAHTGSMQMKASVKELNERLGMQNTQAAIERHKSEIASETQSNASRVASRAAARVRPNQWDQPYQANGEDTELPGMDISFSSDGNVFQKYGHTSFTYDSEGELIKEESVFTNTNGVLNNLYNWAIEIPEGAVVNNVRYFDGLSDENYVFYQDPLTGKEQYIEIYKSIMFNGWEVTGTDQRVDSKGNMVEYDRVESVFDNKERPLTTIYYSRSHVTNPDTGKDTIALMPYRKAEYTYSDDGLITRTRYNNDVNNFGDENWQYLSMVTTGVNDKGEEHYEYRNYDKLTQSWYGTSKYTLIRTDNPDGTVDEILTFWTWDNENQEWYLYEKNHTVRNAMENNILTETFYYDNELEAFYPYSTRGYEYIGDTLQCGDWYLYYKTPSTAEELSNPESLVTRGQKNEYTYYTADELGWSLEDNPNLALPKKSEAIFKYDTESGTWIGSHKNEYKYVLTKSFGDKYPACTLSYLKYYTWDSTKSDWSLYNEKKYGYDEYGFNTLTEVYVSDTISQRWVYKYSHYVQYDNKSDSSLISNQVYEGYFSVKDGFFSPTYTEEYFYNENYQQTRYYYLANYNNKKGTWGYGYRYDHDYDSDGNTILYEYYSWNADKGKWVGNSREVSAYDEYGDRCKYESFYGNENDDDTFSWIPSSSEETKKDASGNIISSVRYSSWDDESSSYQSGSRQEWTYNADGKVTDTENYYLSDGNWVGNYKETYDYDANGNVVQHSFFYYNNDEWGLYQRTAYTYTESGELKDTYESYFYSGVETPRNKQVAQISDGRITGYIDSTYNTWNDTWAPSSKIEYTFGTDGKTTSVLYTWDSYYESWQNSSKEVFINDEENRPQFKESYNWSYSDSIWVGDNKEEFAYGADGKIIMYAYYTWNQSDTVWTGSYKYEEAYDDQNHQVLYAYYSWDDYKNDWYGSSSKYEYAYDASGNQIYYATYSWDYDNWTWKGERRWDYEYDAEGNNIMTTSYESTDSLGNWIGTSKNGYYYKDGTNYNESYTWDYERNDWRGDYKSEYSFSDNSYIRKEYEWDEESWQWIGDYWNEQYYYDNYNLRITYSWDTDKNDWVGQDKEMNEFEDTASSSMISTTDYIWDDDNSVWIPESRNSSTTYYRSDDNIDYELFGQEIYDPVNSRWITDYYLRYTYLYTGTNSVEGIKANMDITVSEGSIIVNASKDANINIVSSAGTLIASGKGSVSVTTAPGVYIITVDGKTTKIMVR